MTLMNFGENIRKARKNAKLTQEDVAKELKTTYQAVSRWENDSNEPDLDTIIKLANLFKVDYVTLLGLPVIKIEEKSPAEAFLELQECRRVEAYHMAKDYLSMLQHMLVKLEEVKEYCPKDRLTTLNKLLDDLPKNEKEFTSVQDEKTLHSLSCHFQIALSLTSELIVLGNRKIKELNK